MTEELVLPVASDLSRYCGWNPATLARDPDADLRGNRIWDCARGPYYLFHATSGTPAHCPGCGRRITPEAIVRA